MDEWQARILPLLDEQGSHPEFDISAYRERLLHNFDTSERISAAPSKKKRGEGDEVKTLPFAEAVQAEEQYEVCRMFLAALQLTNSGNVRLHHEGNIDDGSLKFEVELVTADSSYDFSSL